MVKGVAKLVGKMISLDDPSYRSFLDLPKTETVSRLLLLIVGLGYGAISIASQASYISSFDSALLQNVVVPVIFIIFGILDTVITWRWSGPRPNRPDGPTCVARTAAGSDDVPRWISAGRIALVVG